MHYWSISPHMYAQQTIYLRVFSEKWKCKSKVKHKGNEINKKNADLVLVFAICHVGWNKIRQVYLPTLISQTFFKDSWRKDGIDLYRSQNIIRFPWLLKVLYQCESHWKVNLVLEIPWNLYDCMLWILGFWLCSWLSEKNYTV